MKLVPALASVALAVCVALPAAAQSAPYGYDPNSGYYPNQNYNPNTNYNQNSGYQTNQNYGQSSGLLGGLLGTVVSGLLRQTVSGGNTYGNYQQNYGNYQQYPQYQQNYNGYQGYPNQGNYSYGNQGYNAYGNQGYNPYAAQSGYGGGGLLGGILSAVLGQGLIR